MSHYTVAVFHKKNQSLEELLAPYEEVISIDPNNDQSQMYAIDFFHRAFDDYAKLSDEECWNKIVTEHKPEKDGLIYVGNPNAKWDWWSIGGRWKKMLRLKNSPEKVDSAKVKEIDFSPNKNFHDDAIVEWDSVVEGKTVDGLPPDPFVKKDDLLKTYKTKEAYAAAFSNFQTYAVITPDGEWHAQGEMGWFGIDSATANEEKEWRLHYKERFVDTADPDWELTIVDCHI